MLAQFNPLYHCVQLVRDAVFATWASTTSATSRCCSRSALLTWRLAIRWMEKRWSSSPGGPSTNGPSSTPRTPALDLQLGLEIGDVTEMLGVAAAQDLGGEQPHEPAVELGAGDAAQLVLGLGGRHRDPVGVGRVSTS